MMALTRTICLTLPLLATLAGCSPDFSPNTYNASAVQQANKVEQGVVVGVRSVEVKVAGATGAVAGAAAGGIVGSQLPGSSATQALGTVGGGLLGGLFGSSVEKVAGDTKGYEYIVRKPNNELVSVTQVDTTPMALGQRVLVIAGSQARIVPDYTTAPPEPPTPVVVVLPPAKPAEVKAIPALSTDKPEVIAPTPLAVPVTSTPLAPLPATPALAPVAPPALPVTSPAVSVTPALQALPALQGAPTPLLPSSAP